MKRWLVLNESGTWGEEPTGIADTLVIRSTEIVPGGGWDLSDVAQRYLPPAEARAKRLQVGDIVVVTSSGSPSHLGKAAIVGHDIAASQPCFSNFVQRLRPKLDADPRYIWYLLNSAHAASEMAALGNTTTGLRNLNGAIIGSVTCPGPPLEHQRAIADFLDAETARIDALIAKKGLLAQHLNDRRRTVVFAGITGRDDRNRRMTAVPWTEDLPTSWDEAQLHLVANIGTGHTPSRSNAEYWQDCSIPWVTTGDVAALRSDKVEYLNRTENMISDVGLQNSAAVKHPAGTVFLSRTASAGFSAIMATDMATSQDFVTWTCGPHLSPRYLLLCLRAMRQDLLGRLAQGSTHQTIYFPDIESIRIPLPPRREQDAIADAVWAGCRTIDELKDALASQVDLLQERRRALITAAVTGEVAVPGVEAA